MKKTAIITKFGFSLLLCLLLVKNSGSENNLLKAKGDKSAQSGSQLRSSSKVACNAPSSSAQLNIGNVRARLLNGGDMWWDMTTAAYEIPKGSGKHSIFAGGLWMGGIDINKNLKLAGQTYRDVGEDDYWPGPLDNTGSTDLTVCNAWNTHFIMTKSEIDDFRISPLNMTAAIRDWPAKNNPNNTNVGNRDLAPFVDVNNDGDYDPSDGDYPDIAGEQFVWWIFNDNGNTHTKTGGSPIGVEIHAQAFADNSTTELADMTFYRYKIVNRSGVTLYNTFIGQFIDPDLGCHLDDYVGCDPSRDLGFCYNGDNLDATCATLPGYAPQLASVGLKLLETPYDDNNARLGMSVFATYNNDLSVNGDPVVAADFYNYLMGRWKDNTEMTFGGVGFNGATPTKHLYSGEPCDSSAWSEWLVGNAPGDRRFLVSTGPFTLDIDEEVYFSFAIVWAAVTSTNVCAPVSMIKALSDAAETYYYSNVTVPPPPNVSVGSLETRNMGIKIIPHPVNDKAIVSFSDKSKRIHNFNLYDITGKLVMNENNLNAMANCLSSNKMQQQPPAV